MNVKFWEEYAWNHGQTLEEVLEKLEACGLDPDQVEEWLQEGA